MIKKTFFATELFMHMYIRVHQKVVNCILCSNFERLRPGHIIETELNYPVLGP